AARLDADPILVQARVRRDMEHLRAVANDRLERGLPLRPARACASRRLAWATRVGTLVKGPIAAGQCSAEPPARLPAAMEFLRLRPVDARRPVHPHAAWREAKPLPAAGGVGHALHGARPPLRAEARVVAAALALPPACLDALMIPGETAVQGVLERTR